MKPLFFLFLLFISSHAIAQQFKKCLVYLEDQNTHKAKYLNEIQLYNDKGLLTYSKTFCNNNKDTTCWVQYNINSYNTENLLDTSIVIKSKGDTIMKRFFYNDDAQIDTVLTQQTVHVTRAKIGVTIEKQKEADYCFYNRRGLLVKKLEQRNSYDGPTYYKYNYHYHKKFLSSHIKQMTDSILFSDYKHTDIIIDTGKWFYESYCITDYSKNGFTRTQYNSYDTANVYKSTFTSYKDDEGRVIEETDQTKSTLIIVKYDYFPDKRVIDHYQGMGITQQNYTYVYE